MEAERRIKKVGVYHSLLFLLPVVSLFFYGWLVSDELNERPDNPQRIAGMESRGNILDRNGKALTRFQDNRRLYPEREASGTLVGYQILGRNQTGLEATLRSKLSPPLPPNNLLEAVRRDRLENKESLRGPDIRLSLDNRLQRKIYELLKPWPAPSLSLILRARFWLL